MNLLDLRKYAIDHRVEIRFGDPRISHDCVINIRGQVKIPGEDKDFRLEDVLNAAEEFVIIGKGTAQHLTREAMGKTITESLGRKGSGASAEEEE